MASNSIQMKKRKFNQNYHFKKITEKTNRNLKCRMTTL